MNNEKSEFVSMPEAFVLFWKRSFDFTGRSSRSEYWWTKLWKIIILVVFIYAGRYVHSYHEGLYVLGAFGIYFVLGIVPSISLLARRFRDAGLRGGYIVAMIASYCIPALILNCGAHLLSFLIRIAPHGSVKKFITTNKKPSKDKTLTHTH